MSRVTARQRGGGGGMKVLALVLLPLFFFGLAEFNRWSAGPYRLGVNQDPSYAYLQNGLNLAIGLPPWHIDHPGTPLQSLVGWICRVRYALTAHAGEPFVEHVLDRPELYLTTVSRVLMGLLALSIGALGYWIWRRHGQLWVAVLSQFLVVGYALQQGELARVRPEALIMSVCCWLVIALLPKLEPGQDYDLSLRRNIVVGLLVGLLLACKITAIPLVLLAFTSDAWRRNMVSLAVMAASFVLCIKPAWPLVSRIVAWVLGLMTKSGQYGGGAEGLPSAGTWLDQALHLAFATPLVFLSVALLAVALWLVRRDLLARQRADTATATDDIATPAAESSESASDSGLSELRLPALALTILLGQIVMVSKHPGPHYLLPALPLVVVALAELLRLTERFELNVRHALGYAVGALVVLMALSTVTNTARNHQHNMAYRRDIADVETRLATEFANCRIIGYMGSSALVDAQHHGNDWAGSAHYKILNARFPNAVNYSVNEHAVRTFDGKLNVFSLQPLLDQGECVLLRGFRLTDAQLDDLLFDVEPVQLNEVESLYRVIRVRPKRLEPPSFQ